MDRTRIYDSQIADSAFRYVQLDRSEFTDTSFKDCVFKNCDLNGMTIDGICIEEALDMYKKMKGIEQN